MYNQAFFDFEQYAEFAADTAQNIGLALAAILIVVLFITANLVVTAFVLLCVALVVLNVLGSMFYWDITLNSVSVVNSIIAIGLAVDYSAHIAHAYQEASYKSQDKVDIRLEKTRKALGTMGSSVFHGAFSTFLAVVTLSASKSYIFRVFFSMWFGIVVYGILHGFVLMPVMLSYLGPLTQPSGQAGHKVHDKKSAIDEEKEATSQPVIQKNDESVDKKSSTSSDSENRKKKLPNESSPIQ